MIQPSSPCPFSLRGRGEKTARGFEVPRRANEVRGKVARRGIQSEGVFPYPSTLRKRSLSPERIMPSFWRMASSFST